MARIPSAHNPARLVSSGVDERPCALHSDVTDID